MDKQKLAKIDQNLNSSEISPDKSEFWVGKEVTLQTWNFQVEPEEGKEGADDRNFLKHINKYHKAILKDIGVTVDGTPKFDYFILEFKDGYSYGPINFYMLPPEIDI